MCWTNHSPGIRPLGGAARWWLAQSLRSLQRSLSERGATLVLRRGAAAQVVAELARQANAEAVYFNDIAMAPARAVAAELAARSPTMALPSTNTRRPAGGAGNRPQQGGPRPQSVHAVLEASAVARRSAENRSPPHSCSCPRAGGHQRPVGGLGAGADRAGLGGRAARKPGSRAKPPRKRRCSISSPTRSRATRKTATAPTGPAPRGCRRICGSARSARARSGTPHDSPPQSGRRSPATSTSSSANWAGGSSAGICCSTISRSRDPESAAGVRCVSLAPTIRQGCKPGSAAKPVIRSSMPACANSGKPG